jgi:hypothetical protein
MPTECICVLYGSQKNNDHSTAQIFINTDIVLTARYKLNPET